MSHQTFVITGASRGLGLEFVKQAAAQGDTVFALARNPAASERLQNLVDNEKVFAITIDITNEESIKAAVEQVAKLAPNGIDVLINNAGVISSGNLEIETKANFLRVFETNVVGVNDIINAFLPLLRLRGQDNVKKILNISSVLGSITRINEKSPTGRTAAYSISKAALNMLVKMWAGILAKENFVVYSSHPGWVKTEMGGDNAPVEIADSISGLLQILDKVTVADNGGFFDYTGESLPW